MKLLLHGGSQAVGGTAGLRGGLDSSWGHGGGVAGSVWGGLCWGRGVGM